MSLITGEQAPPDELPFEDMPVPPLGGSVRVRALLLSDQLEIEQRLAQIPEDDKSKRFRIIPEVLARSVVDANGRPLFNATRWEIFGAKNRGHALDLFNKAWYLSGMGGDEAKKN
jgi:hypothetical protein